MFRARTDRAAEDNNYSLKISEDGAFRIIQKEVSEKKVQYKYGAIANAIAVRAHIGIPRSFNDLDIVFPDSIPYSYLVCLAQSCADTLALRPVGPEASSIHAVYHIPTDNISGDGNLAGEFSIHLHSRGIWQKNECYKLDACFFESIKWCRVNSVGSRSVVLPIPAIEEVLLLKARRFAGNDKCDILSILSKTDLDLYRIRSRVQELKLENVVQANLAYLEDTYEKQLNTWHHVHQGHELTEKGVAYIKENLKRLSNIIRITFVE